MNPEIQLIAKILDTGDLKSFAESGLKAEDLMDQDCETYMSWLIEYYTDPKHPRTVPTKEVFAEYMPEAILPEPDRTSVPELVEICKKRCARKMCQQLGEELILRAEEDPAAAFAYAASSSIREIGKLTDTRTVSLGDYAEDIMDEYEKAKRGEFSGIPWPWEPLNKRTKGIENGNFVLIYGRAKQMKTWIALYVATEYYRRYGDSRVLVYSLEMTVKQMAQRTAGIMARVPYSESILGSLPPEDETRYLEVLSELKVDEEACCTNGRRKGFFIVSPANSGAGILDLRNKIEFYNPDLVIIDGVYYMAGTMESKRLDWREIAKVSRDIKVTAIEYDTPIIGVSQANRDDDAGNTMTDVGFTDNFARDPDIIMKVHKQETSHLGMVMAIMFKGVREFDVPGILIHGKPATSFDFIKEFDNIEQISEFIKKSKQAVATVSTREDLSRVVGKENFIRSQMTFGSK